MEQRNRIIERPDGAAVYDGKSGTTLRLNRQEASRFISNYTPQRDVACPEIVHLEVTSECNLNCEYCYHPKYQTAPPMLLDELKDLISRLADFGVFQITFGGGEPLMHEGILELAHHAAKCALNTTMTTNGILLGALEDGDLRLFRQINISFHPAAAKNGFDLKEALETLTRAGVAAGISFIVSRENLKYLPGLVDLASQTNSELLLLSYKSVQPDVATPVPFAIVRRMAENIANEGISVAVDSLVNNRCAMNERLWTISSSGDVYPCSFVREWIGNVKQSSLSDLWSHRGAVVACPYL